MNNRKSKKRRKAQKLFSPDKISTRIASAIERDLVTATLAYGGTTGALLYYKKAQKANTLKKYKSEVPSDTLANVAYDTFYKTNDHMSKFDSSGLMLPGDDDDLSERSRILRSARSICYNILSPLTEEEWFYRTKHSGGTSQGVSFIDTSLEAKFTLPISCNESVKVLVDRYLSFDFQLRERLYDPIERTGTQKPRYLDSDTSRATTVSKNDTTDRMIAIETTWNMFFQQGLMQCMYDRMQFFGLDVRSLPDKHKNLAQASSIHGLNSTIDFSSASDCVSYDLVKWLIPPAWFHRLKTVRSPHMKFPNGDVVRLNMFSTMGNAVTFPLETIVFYSLAVATVFQSGLKPGHYRNILPTTKSKRSVSVFGDDCILPTSCSNTFMKICESVGFLVNKEKSFFSENGGFRESCGGDYFHGIDVRPCFIKEPTSCKESALAPWLYTIYNGLLKKYEKYFGNLTYLYENRSLALLQSIFQEHNLHLRVVPGYFPDDAGLKIGHDIDRFRASYPNFIISRLAIGDHGSVEFSYCRYIYNVKSSVDPNLRYFTDLKSRMMLDIVQKLGTRSFVQKHLELEQETEYRKRKNGGYVIAKAITPFWGAIANRKHTGL